MEDRKILYFIESIQSNKHEDGTSKYFIVMEDVEESRERSYFRLIERESIPKPSNSAYSGIYSPRVINYFGSTLRYSEKDGASQLCKAYVLDWCGNSERYVY